MLASNVTCMVVKAAELLLYKSELVPANGYLLYRAIP